MLGVANLSQEKGGKGGGELGGNRGKLCPPGTLTFPPREENMGKCAKNVLKQGGG